MILIWISILQLIIAIKEQKTANCVKQHNILNLKLMAATDVVENAISPSSSLSIAAGAYPRRYRPDAGLKPRALEVLGDSAIRRIISNYL